MLRKGSAKDNNEDLESEAIWKQNLVAWMVSMAMGGRMFVVLLEKER